jgi:formate/nitrite transporter FocA (FNT family)
MAKPARAQHEPREGTRFTADEIHENVLKASEGELERPVTELGLSGLAAGLGIGFSFVLSALLTEHMGSEHHAVASAIAYPVGFIFVVLARHQLFTENTLEPVIPLLEKRDMKTLRQVARLWAIVLPANLIGAAIFAFVAARTQSFEPSLNASMMETARMATSGAFSVIFLKAIWAGWLVALMAWIIASTHETIAQIALIWVTTAPIAALGFKHSIAGATEAFYRAWTGDATLTDMLVRFEVPAIVGNIIGGIVLVALVNHGQTGAAKSKQS